MHQDDILFSERQEHAEDLSHEEGRALSGLSNISTHQLRLRIGGQTDEDTDIQARYGYPLGLLALSFLLVDLAASLV